jgi:PAS domain S-box-containing protein
MYRLYGITKDQFGGAYEAWQGGLHPEDRQRGDAEIQLALKGERDFDAEFRVLWPDGSVHYIRGFASVERDASGQPLRMVGTNWDMTERKLAEEELARLSVIQRELMHLATEFVNVPLECQNAAIEQSLATIGQLIHADRAYLFSYDFSRGVMSNTHEWCDSGVAPEIDNLQAVPNALFPDWVEAHQRGQWIHIPSVAALPAESSLRRILEPQGICSLITLPLMQGEVCLGFVGFDAAREERAWQQEEVALLRVLAELYAHFEARRAEERELIQARDVAQTAVLAKSLFLANMSHEIRTPLNAILGYAQIMERECRACPTKQRLSAITRGGEHLLELLNDLLELVRTDSHQVTLSPGFFDFYQVLEDVRLIFVGSAQAKGLTLELSLAPDVPKFIHADSGKVRQILLNLIGNAVKFTASGGVSLSVFVQPGASPAEFRIVVDIQDTGCGIEQNEQARIFNIFEQADPAKRSGKGAGLGLFLSRRYAQAHGGDVTVSSRPGQGSCFRFAFHARIARGGEVVHRSRMGNVQRLSAGQRAWRLLVVDDESANRDMLAGMLEAVGFTVETAVDAAQALQRICQMPEVDLVLMDKCLPEIDGYEAIRRLRELPKGAGLPVLIVTASGFADELQLALAAGADGYVAKPVRLDRLLAEIGNVTDVHYDYEPPAPYAPQIMREVGLEVPSMACVPRAQRELLDRALHRGDIHELRDLIAGMEGEHAELAVELRVLVDTYEYGRLHEMLNSIPSETL